MRDDRARLVDMLDAMNNIQNYTVLGKNAFKELKHIPIFQPRNLIFFAFLPDGSATATEFSGSELIVITNDCLFKMFTVADLAKTSLIYVSTFLKRFFDLDL